MVHSLLGLTISDLGKPILLLGKLISLLGLVHSLLGLTISDLGKPIPLLGLTISNLGKPIPLLGKLIPLLGKSISESFFGVSGDGFLYVQQRRSSQPSIHSPTEEIADAIGGYFWAASPAPGPSKPGNEAFLDPKIFAGG